MYSILKHFLASWRPCLLRLPVLGQNERSEDAAEDVHLALSGQRRREFAAVRSHFLRRLVQSGHEVGDGCGEDAGKREDYPFRFCCTSFTNK